MYMSYCRFEGTRAELNTCIGEVVDHINEEAEHSISDREIYHFKQMVQDFIEFLQDTEILNEDGELDEEALESVCKSMATSCQYEEET